MKPKKNAGKEIRGWAVVSKMDGEIMCWSPVSAYLDYAPLAIYEKRKEIPNARSLEKVVIKRCRIILD